MQGLTPGEMGLPRDARFVQPLDDDRLRTARQLLLGGNLRHRWLRLASVAMKTWTLAFEQRAAVRIDG